MYAMKISAGYWVPETWVSGTINKAFSSFLPIFVAYLMPEVLSSFEKNIKNSKHLAKNVERQPCATYELCSENYIAGQKILKSPGITKLVKSNKSISRRKKINYVRFFS